MSDGPRQPPADECFALARKAAAEEQFDLAIDYFLQGLVIEPDRVDGHRGLRSVALERKVDGGRALGMFETMKLKRQTQNHTHNMLMAEKLLAYDPGNSDHMLVLLQNAAKAGLEEVVAWIEPILRRANREARGEG